MENSNVDLFLYCPSCRKKSLKPDCEKSFVCKKCDFKFYINTAAACIALIFDEKKRLLVTRRKHDPAAGMLDLPGGFIEPGETVEAGLCREIKEELNLDIISTDYYCSVPNRYQYRQVLYPIADLVFKCQATNFSNIMARDDVSEFYFLDIQEIDTALFGLFSPKFIIEKLKQDPS